MSNSAVTMLEAARALGCSLSTLRRDIRAGAPVVRRGGRGRGRTVLIDVNAHEAWRRSRTTSTAPAQVADDRLLTLAAELPELLANAVYEVFINTDGPHKVPSAEVLAQAWYQAAVAVLDRMREFSPLVADVESVPAKIDRLRAIYENHTVDSRYYGTVRVAREKIAHAMSDFDATFHTKSMSIKNAQGERLPAQAKRLTTAEISPQANATRQG